MPTTFETWSAERKTVWEANAVVKDRIEMVLTALRKKFKNVPGDIEEAVLARTDAVALKSLLEHVFDCNTLDEFATML